MLDLQFIRDNPDLVRRAITDKGAGDPEAVPALLEADERRREVLTALQQRQERLNAASREIGELMRAKRVDEANARRAETGQLKEEIKGLEEQQREADAAVRRLLLEIPNVPHPSVPVGKTPEENVVAFEQGEKPTFDFEPLPHWELSARHKLIDFERGAKVTGAGFPFYVGQGARLQRALIQFFLDLAAEAGYTEMQPPLVVNHASGEGTGQIPDKEGQMYSTYGSDPFGSSGEKAASGAEVLRVGADTLRNTQPSLTSVAPDTLAAFMEDMAGTLEEVAQSTRLFLVPTAEVPVTNFHRDEILDDAALPILYAAYTPCFRREAGSYGKDVRGLNRLHQFDKVELVRFV
ncbi:MAG TPA: aminoacyl--tRNA ligase-related protein, partial [Rubricoccaceae bacterium]|nr:aminoacyl--tRNA ligase-related protein [Rubricoccaceae bacterium]